MQQTDDVISGWLSGSDDYDSPAGPLYIHGTAATEVSMTDKGSRNNLLTSQTSVSCFGGAGAACPCC